MSQKPDDAQQTDDAPAADNPKHGVWQRLLGLTVPIAMLIILYAIFIGLLAFAEKSGFSLPRNFKSFLFVVLLLISISVFFSQILKETIHFEHNGILVAGTLAFVVVFGYLIIRYWPQIEEIFDPQEYTLAEVRLSCDEDEPDVQAQNIYALVSGDQGYIKQLRQTLAAYKRTGRYDLTFVEDSDPVYRQLWLKARGQSDWVAYSVSQGSTKDVIPVPTRLDANHRSIFLIDSVPNTAGAEAELGDNADPMSPSGELIEIAQVTIDPEKMEEETGSGQARAAEVPPTEPDAGPGLSGRAHRVRLVLTLNGSQTPCWSPAMTPATQ